MVLSLLACFVLANPLYLIAKDRAIAEAKRLSIAVNVEGVAKKFGNIQALNNVTFNIKEGEVYGLIGPNGAGKTTTLRMISTLILPTSGLATVFGLDVVRQADAVRKILSYLPEEAGAYRNLSGQEYLQFMAKFSGSDTKDALAQAADHQRLGRTTERQGKNIQQGYETSASACSSFND